MSLCRHDESAVAQIARVAAVPRNLNALVEMYLLRTSSLITPSDPDIVADMHASCERVSALLCSKLDEAYGHIEGVTFALQAQTSTLES